MTPVAYGYEARYLLSEWSVDRFWSKVDTSDECWLWMGTTSKGYGRHHDSGTWHPAHRIAYELLVGPVPEGLTLDHLCRVRNCVNPAHLEPVTTRENVMRGVSVAAQNARKTHCKHGHPFEGENVLYLNGGRFRHCRPCHARRSRERRFRLRLRRLEERQANAGTDGFLIAA